MHRFIPLILFGISSQLGLASEIILNRPLVAKLEKQLRDHPYFLKVGPAKVNIYGFEIGRADTPFYSTPESKSPKRYYRKSSIRNDSEKCFELSVLPTENVARRVRCVFKRDELKLPGFSEYAVVSPGDLYRSGLKSFTAREMKSDYKILGFLLSEDSPEFILAKTSASQFFKVSVLAKDDVTLTPDSLSLRQEMCLTTGDLGLMNGRTFNVVNNVTLKNGGLIFANSYGEVLVYFQPHPNPFNEVFMNPNLSLNIRLENMAEESKVGPVCFSDGAYAPREKDCFRSVFDRDTVQRYELLNLLKIDFKNFSAKPVL